VGLLVSELYTLKQYAYKMASLAPDDMVSDVYESDEWQSDVE